MPKKHENNYIPLRPDSDGNKGLGARIREAARKAGWSVGKWIREACKRALAA